MASRGEKSKIGNPGTQVFEPLDRASFSVSGEIGGEGGQAAENGTSSADEAGDYASLSVAIAQGVARGEVTTQALERYLEMVESDRAAAEERAAVMSSRFAKLSVAMVGLGLVIAGVNVASLFRETKVLQPVVVNAAPRTVEPAPPAAAPVVPPPVKIETHEPVAPSPPVVEQPRPMDPPTPKRRLLPRPAAPQESPARAIAIRSRAPVPEIEPKPEIAVVERW